MTTRTGRPDGRGRLNTERMQHIAAAIQERPGLTQSEIARALGIRPCVVYVALPQLEAHGVLLCEDEAGRLYPAEETR